MGEGTAFANRIAGLEMCGKTGTAQNPHGKDHAVFLHLLHVIILKLPLRFLLKMQVMVVYGQVLSPV